MKRRTLVALGTILVTVVGIIVGDLRDWPSPQEPRYDGKPLSHWCGTMADYPYQKDRPSLPFLKKIGREAVPWLVWTIDRGPYRRPADLALTRALIEKPVDWLREEWSSFKEWDDRRAVRRATQQKGAVYILGSLGSKAEPAVGRLAEDSLSGGERFRALSLAPGSLPYIFRAARSVSAHQRLAAIENLPVQALYEGQIAAEEWRSIKDILVESLNDPDKWVRALAAKHLRLLITLMVKAPEPTRSIATPTEKMINILISALADPDPKVSEHVAVTLSAWGTAIADATPSLLPLISHPQPKTRAGAVVVLGAIGAPVERTAERFREMLRKDPDEACRTAAAIALAAQGAVDEEVIQGLIVGASHEGAAFDSPALKALAGIGEPAADAILPVVLEVLRDYHLSHSVAAKDIGAFFARFGGRATPHLIEALSHPSVAVKTAAIAALPLDDARTHPALRNAYENKPNAFLRDAIDAKLKTIDAHKGTATKGNIDSRPADDRR